MHAQPTKKGKDDQKDPVNTEEAAPKVTYDNRWDLEYSRLRGLGYTHEQANAVISKQRIDLLFRDPDRTW